MSSVGEESKVDCLTVACLTIQFETRFKNKIFVIKTVKNKNEKLIFINTICNKNKNVLPTLHFKSNYFNLSQLL